MRTPIINLHQQYVGDLVVPSLPEFNLWVSCALDKNLNYELAIVLVDEEYSAQLNNQFRAKNYPTNVLSFNADLDPISAKLLDVAQLGDLIICVPIVYAEASAQNKNVKAHFAHLVIHGCLHLLGFDHEDECDAQIMEQLEINLLAKLNLPNPYL